MKMKKEGMKAPLMPSLNLKPVHPVTKAGRVGPPMPRIVKSLEGKSLETVKLCQQQPVSHSLQKEAFSQLAPSHLCSLC